MAKDKGVEQKVRQIVTKVFGTHATTLDRTIIEYVVSILADGGNEFDDDGEELNEVIFPLLLDTGCVSSEDETLQMSTQILEEMTTLGLRKPHTKSGHEVTKLSEPVNLMSISEGMSKPAWMDGEKSVTLVDNDKLEAAKSKQKVPFLLPSSFVIEFNESE